MDAIKAIYFQECAELLASLEEGLLALDAGEGDADTINSIFRAVHSVKGGAGAFGFEDLVAFAHVFETTLDAMRSGRLEPGGEAIKTMLRASDMLADHVLAAKGEGAVNGARTQAMAEELSALILPYEHVLHSFAPAGQVDMQPAGDDWGFASLAKSISTPAKASAGWRLIMRPTAEMYAKGHDALLFLRELSRLGPIVTSIDAETLPDLASLNPEAAYLNWVVELPPNVAEAAIREVFDFVGEDCPIELTRIGSAEAAAYPPIGIEALGAARPNPPAAAKSMDEKPAPIVAANAAAAGMATIRVDLDRVDRMIDLVGELVINQTMLAERVAECGMTNSSTVAIGLEELEQLTREIQDSVMAIRAQPVRSVFQRMPRLVREIAGSIGKQVRLVMEGESTEVDTTVIERLADPITHMLRNAIDHGLETPEERSAAGKSPEGTVRLAALHRAGRIVIEISDDGKGVNRSRVREIAVQKGLIAPDTAMSDGEIDNLIFLPGFSTAASVSNISGRGVGMDVAKRSIHSLGGRISISSLPGIGATFTLSLPLTLAVIDGMVVSVGGQTLVVPLTGIIETLRPKKDEVRRLGASGAVLAVRGAHVPLVDVGVALGLRADPIDPTIGVTLLVESDVRGRAALVVDNIQGQRQVVMKSLEANFQRVDGIAAATILGDGLVALILDIETVIDMRLSKKLEATLLAKAS